jgi:acetate kinase
VAYSKPVRIDARVIAVLEELVPLAPLHQPHHLAAIRAVEAAAPDVPQVACFDTAFHCAQPALAQEFALPRRLTGHGIRRYGFHGLSYEYITGTLPSVAPEIAQGRIVVAHLGNGASMCAIRDGQSVASTMGFTAVDGLPMGTRTGTIDPGVILYLLQHEGMDVKAVEHLIYQESGLLGVSGLSSDMRTLLASDRPEAREAVDLFVYRIGRELARWWPLSEGSTGSCLRAGSASMRPRSAPGSAGMRTGSASSWTRWPTRRAVHASPRRVQTSRPGSCPRTRT